MLSNPLAIMEDSYWARSSALSQPGIESALPVTQNTRSRYFKDLCHATTPFSSRASACHGIYGESTTLKHAILGKCVTHIALVLYLVKTSQGIESILSRWLCYHIQNSSLVTNMGSRGALSYTGEPCVTYEETLLGRSRSPPCHTRLGHFRSTSHDKSRLSKWSSHKRRCNLMWLVNCNVHCDAW